MNDTTDRPSISSIDIGTWWPVDGWKVRCGHCKWYGDGVCHKEPAGHQVDEDYWCGDYFPSRVECGRCRGSGKTKSPETEGRTRRYGLVMATLRFLFAGAGWQREEWQWVETGRMEEGKCMDCHGEGTVKT